NAVIFFQLMATMAMRRLAGFGNSLLENYCSAAFHVLQQQKQQILEHNPDAQFPSDASVFPAATIQFGGPQAQTWTGGIPDRYETLSWSALAALGKYNSFHGGHIVLWNLGLVVSFPTGSTILLPPALVRYSFVKVRAGEYRYSILQWVGSGIARWIRNGRCTNVEFGLSSTRAEHDEREEARNLAQESALDVFPIESELPYTALRLPYPGPPVLESLPDLEAEAEAQNLGNT
ncbi:hypothetical protein C8R43DRAFT_910225, partial [Mycena crocata]